MKKEIEKSQMSRNEKTSKLAKMGMLVAISIVLVSTAAIIPPFFPTAPYLRYDPADIPIFIGAFAFGPGAGFMLTCVTSIIQGLTISVDSWVGIIMHIFATGSFVLVAGSIYSKIKTKKGAILALVVGTIVMTSTMVLWNIAITPIYTGIPRDAVIAMVFPVIIPFNLLKAGINSIVTFILYKSIANFLHK